MKRAIEQRVKALEEWRDETSKDAEIGRLRAEIMRLTERLMREEQKRAEAEIARDMARSERRSSDD